MPPFDLRAGVGIADDNRVPPRTLRDLMPDCGRFLYDPSLRCLRLRGTTSLVNHSDDLPYPSRLVLGSSRGRPLHVVVADDDADADADATTIVVMVYEPDPSLWRPGNRKRRRP